MQGSDLSMGVNVVREDYYKCFKYREKGYASHTEIKIKQSYLDTHLYKGKKIWSYARFDQRSIHDGKVYCNFSKCKLDLIEENNKYCGYFLVPEEDLELLIEEIIKPIELTLAHIVKKKDHESSEVITGWIIYMLIMFISFILTEWYIVWLWATIVFFLWRNKKLWE